MQPNKRAVLELFQMERRYAVPLYQRRYVWSEERQWRPLWEDIQRKAFDELSRIPSPVHFLGAMVLETQETFGNDVTVQAVIDGQQRLTTMQIFLAAFRDVCGERDYPGMQRQLAQYLINDCIMSRPDIERYKVWPSAADRVVYRDIIDAGSKTELDKRYPLKRLRRRRKNQIYEVRETMVEAYSFFHFSISSFLDNEEYSQPVNDRIDALRSALRSGLQVVTIELQDDDDPQVIFETLNARGEPLLPFDLVRNFTFMRAASKKEDAEHLHQLYWSPFDDSFWREHFRQGRLVRPRTDHFLQAYLTAKRCKDIHLASIFAEYRHWIRFEAKFSKIEDELSALATARDHYFSIFRSNDDSPSASLRRLMDAFDVSTLVPIALEIFSQARDQSDAKLSFSTLESYIVRRAVLGWPTKAYNRIFLAALSAIRKRRDQSVSAAIKEELLTLSGESGEWPTDQTLREALHQKPIYRELTSAKLTYILSKLDAASTSSKTEEVKLIGAVQVEHLLPQQWQEHWRLPNNEVGLKLSDYFLKPADDEVAKLSRERDRLLHTIGNLTLVTGSWNASLGNGPFSKKVSALKEHSALALNRYFFDLGTWDETSIELRTERLFEIARIVWSR